MRVLWERRMATVAEVVGALPPPHLAYSTVLTTLRTLEEKRYLGHRSVRRAYVFYPLVEQRAAAHTAVRHVVDRFFSKSPSLLIFELLSDSSIEYDDLGTIEGALAARRA